LSVGPGLSLSHSLAVYLRAPARARSIRRHKSADAPFSRGPFTKGRRRRTERAFDGDRTAIISINYRYYYDYCSRTPTEAARGGLIGARLCRDDRKTAGGGGAGGGFTTLGFKPYAERTISKRATCRRNCCTSYTNIVVWPGRCIRPSSPVQRGHRRSPTMIARSTFGSSRITTTIVYEE